jgi:hypothetical protein
MQEKDLYLPVRNLFAELGYQVNAEVNDCDLTAVKEDELLIIELKRNLSVTLLAQALVRQKTGATVYVAVPKPARYSPKKYRDTLYVLKKLELGLIFVTFRGDISFAEVIHDPKPFVPVKVNTKKKTAILKEISGRTMELNEGGVTHRKIVTAYRERCICAACILEHLGPSSPRQIRAYGADERVGTLMLSNPYGWFARIEKGVYTVTEKGRQELSLYPELVSYYSEQVKQLAENQAEE